MYRKTSNLSCREIKKARAGERRDCAKYESCLTKAALIDAICVPCHPDPMVVESSPLLSVEYDETKKTLHVEFQSGNQYVYRRVSLALYDRLTKTLSTKGFSMKTIAGIFEYQKLPQGCQKFRHHISRVIVPAILLFIWPRCL